MFSIFVDCFSCIVPYTFRFMKKYFALFLMPIQLMAQGNSSAYVNPFIGTGGHGHTFPGPTMPFGMVQLSPDTRLDGWDGCSGYHYSDQKIYGFSHTHLSGTGCSDYGDVLLMPTVGSVAWNNEAYASGFKKESEKASAGYYTVFLDKPGVKAELTTTVRTGLHRYTFPKSEAANVLVDLTHRDKVKFSEISINGTSEISGKRISSAWASNQVLYFVIQFSKPFKQVAIAKNNVIKQGKQHLSGKNIKCFVQFDTQAGEQLMARVGISAVSVDGARENLAAEQPEFNFEKTRLAAEAAWNRELSKIAVETENEKDKTIFYTALYHSMIAPNVYQDVDGSYRGRDGNIHQTKDFTYHTVFSLWDTYRALHPLLTLIDQKRTSDFVNTLITQFEHTGFLPIWELSANETYCMIGYHAVPVMAEAYLKGVKGFDANKALQAMQVSASLTKNQLKSTFQRSNISGKFSFYRYSLGWDDYQKLGYIRNKPLAQSVSKTLEYAYDDWCIAQMAKKLGQTEVHKAFSQRAANYRNLFDASTGFMRPKDKSFMSPFDPYKVDHNFTEGNAWQYSFYVPQDLKGHIGLLGGREKLAQFLDTLFSTTSKLTGHQQPDITGLIGQYVHGNEPSHQIAYEYNYVGQPWKTQAMVRRILNEMYSEGNDGLSGNEDCGQMSAWYVFSALGFYPVCPGSDHYAIGSPIFRKASIHLENGKDFTVETSGKGVYIQKASLNGSPYTKSFLQHSDILQGGILRFEMGQTPNMAFGTGPNDVPETTLE